MRPVKMPDGLTPYQRFARLANGLFSVSNEELRQMRRIPITIEERDKKKHGKTRKSRAA